MTMTISGSSGLVFPDGSGQETAIGRNRIINGDMRIDQRNAGASVSISTGANNYTIDRWQGQGTPSAGVYTVQRSTTAPSEFVNSFLATVTTADASLAAGDLYSIGQFIEGFNVADLGWGTANAKTVTISFWVRSSVTGTFGGSVGNSAFNRSYPFTYTISTANTFEYKTITIAGDTTGTWLTDNGIGVRLYFGLGVGSAYSGTAGAWAGAGTLSATGATNLMATNGATWYVTGVQLEQNTSATPFERRLYNQELANCQRYYNRWSGANSPNVGLTTCLANGGTSPGIRRASWANPVDFRSAPTLGLGGTIQLYTSGLSNLGFVSFNGAMSNKNIISFDINTTSSGTAGQGIMLIIDSSSAANYIDASAEL